MPDAPKKPQTRKSHPWLRRIGRTLGVLLLLAAVFHRPLFHTVARFALIQVAKRNNVTLDVHFSGTIFTNLSVRDVRAEPSGAGPTPVEKIAIEAVHLEYSIPMLIQHGVGEFLQSYSLTNAELAFRADPSRTEEEKQKKKSIAEDLNNLLAQPAAYADEVRIENFNITVRAPGSVTEVRGIHLFLHPWQPGYLRVGRVAAPGVPTWENLAAETSYVKRNMFIKGLVLAPELVIDELNFDASQRAQNKGSMSLRGRFFGGTAKLSLAGTQLKKKGENLQQSYDTSLDIEAAGIDVDAAAAYFGARSLPQIQLGWLALHFRGEPERPRTWDGTLGVRAEALGFGKVIVDAAEMHTAFAKGEARVTAGHAAIGENVVTLTGAAQLPESVNDFRSTEGEGAFQIQATQLQGLTKLFMPQDAIAGSVTGGGTVVLRDRRAAGELSLAATQVGAEKFGVASAKIAASATKLLDTPEGASALHGLDSRVDAELGGLRFSSFTADAAKVNVETRGEIVTLHTFEVARGENRVSAKGTYRIPRAGEEALSVPLDAEYSVRVPKLEDFGLGAKGVVLRGQLEGSGKVRTVEGVQSGSVQIGGTSFAFGDFKADKLTAKIAVADNTAEIEELVLQINERDRVAITGRAGVQKPFAYEGALLVLIRDLGALQPLLEVFGVREPLAGALDFSTESEGRLQPAEHHGRTALSLDKARYGKIEIEQVKVGAIFGPQFAETSELRIVSGSTSFEGGLEWRDAKIKLKDINLRQGDQQALSGYVIVPFDPSNKAQPVPLDKRLAANVNVNQLSIEKLLASLGKTPPVTGTVTANLVAGGTLLRPTAHLKVAARALKSPAKAAAAFDAAEIDLVAHYSEKELTLDATARQKQIQPLTVKGRVPLDLEAAVEAKKLDPNLPLDLTVRLPPTSLAFIPKIAPQVRRIEGTAGIDAHIGGTVGKPELSGSAAMRIEFARMASEGVPSLGAFQADLAFTEDLLTVKRFRGEAGGGSFDAGGKVQFTRITEPTFDLRLQSRDMLVKRDESVTVRVDTDIRLDGPLAAAKVAGTVWVTNSRFFREIDILPIALPGRPKPKPQPKSVPTEKTVSFDKPPLRDWTFDIAIKTRPNDPFAIRGNLASGSAAIDLRFAGPGVQPYLEGSVRVDNLVASLPFSKLTIQRGFVTFSKDAPFRPKLEIQAESTLREYRINAYIFGSAEDPQLSLTSEPPLPQEDILALLATGTTTSELTGNTDVLASRAAVLVFQQLYRKVFKKKDPMEQLPLLDRFNWEVGAVDSRTGQQEISASFQLGENLYLVGDVDVTGAVAARVKYLVKFR